MLMDIIRQRCSIRSFTGQPVDRAQVEQILEAARLAPSAKNRQPWRFVVVTENQRDSMIEAMRRGLEHQELFSADFTGMDRAILDGAWYTLGIMRQAPVTVFILNSEGGSPMEPLEEFWFLEMANLQSIGASIEHMCLMATELGLGSLWICDVFSAYEDLRAWLGTDAQLVAAVSFGYTDERPNPRPRKPLSDLVQWR